MNKTRGRSKVFKIMTHKHQVDFVTDQHLLSPFSSPFLGVKCLYDYGFVMGCIFFELRSRIHRSLTGGDQVNSGLGLSYRPANHVAWHAGTTALCRSWLYPPGKGSINFASVLYCTLSTRILKQWSREWLKEQPIHGLINDIYIKCSGTRSLFNTYFNFIITSGISSLFTSKIAKKTKILYLFIVLFRSSST